MRSIAFVLTGALLCGAAFMAAAAPITETGSASFSDGVAATLNGSWLVTIDGQKRPRTLTVFGLAKTGFGSVAADAAMLDGSYGFADSTLYPAKVTAQGTLSDFEIAFTSSAGAKIRARTVSPTELRGTFEFKGETKPVVIKRSPVTASAKRDSKITVIYIGAFD